MNKYLILEDGTTYPGIAFGDQEAQVAGELVFNTAMTGYQEALTDPSYLNQLLTFTNPLIGTYGIWPGQSQSKQVTAGAVIVRQLENEPGPTGQTLNAWLVDHHVPGIEGVDTRTITMHLREDGTVKALLVNQQVTPTEFTNLYNRLVGQQKLPARNAGATDPTANLTVALIDLGVKQGIIDNLAACGGRVVVLPPSATVAEVHELNPAGVLISNGPGDPLDYQAVLPLIRGLEHDYPLAGICLGHQLLALANGATTYRLPFGHRGANHPVTLLTAQQTIMTSQNHGYAVDPTSLKQTGLKVTAVEGNDHTVEGLTLVGYPVISVQFHPEAGPGPNDARDFFNHFKQLMETGVAVNA